jgi:PEP-CTERM motif
MARTLIAAFIVSLCVAVPAPAATITWFASNEVISVSRFADFVIGPGLTIGTPWSLTVSFDPAAPPVSSPTPGCNSYALGSSTLTLGSYSYSGSGGQVWTNAALPEVGCFGMLPEGLSGQIEFFYGTSGWHSDDPGAWNLANWGGVTIAAYYDQLVKDGTLPIIPTFSPDGGRWQNWLEIENDLTFGTLLNGGVVQFQLVDQPSPVPEPATMTLFGAGLAALIARRRRRR